MFEKRDIKLKIAQAETLNNPGWYSLFKTQIKTASTQKDSTDLNGFDIEAAREEHPDHLFVKVFAIKEDEVNDNGDAFSKDELKEAAHTFVGVPIFTNHQNDDIEKARGKCVHSWYDKEAKGIYIISMIDKVAYAPLARGIEEGYILGSSMGASVDFSCCSVCHNRAAVATQYCDHISGQKNRKFSGKIACKYHDSEDKPKDDCPVCGKKYKENKKIAHNEQQIFEWNYGVKFIEDSFVVNPACHDCLVCEILNPAEVKRKIASVNEKLEKLQKIATCDQGCNLEKVAGQRELKYLTEVMDKLEVVAKTMMSQKKNVSMEYVSDLVEVLANVQSISDELEEMGYGQLASPDIETIESIELPKESVEETEQIQQPQPQMQQPQMPQQQVTQTAPGIVSEDFGDLGSITKPKYSENLEIKKKEFLRQASSLIEKLDLLQENFIVSDSEIKESIMDSKTGQEQNTNEKVAASPQKHDTNVITEKQLEDAKFTGERQGKGPQVITEKQMENPDRDVNVTTSDTPTERKDENRGVITEKQLNDVTSGYVARWNDYPKVITEKQWTDTSKMIGSELSKDQDTIITEKQLNDFRDHHRFVLPSVITEKQLTVQDGDLSRYAYTYDPNRLVKAASEVISDVIAYYGKTPNDIKQAASFMTEDVRNLDKAAFITLINALPTKEAERKSEKERYTYFAKMASTVKAPSTLDALTVAMADHLEDMSADDLVNAVYHVANNEKTAEKIENLVKAKLNNEPEYKQTNKIAQLQEAMNDLNKPEDGMYRVDATIDEIKPEKNTKEAINFAAYKFANKKIAEEVGSKVDTALLNVSFDKDKKCVMATVKDVSMLTEEESAKWKEAQGLFRIERVDEPEDDLQLEGPEDLEDVSISLDVGEDWQDGDWGEQTEDDVVVDMEENLEGKDKDMFMFASRKENRENMVKEAQMLGGEMGGQAGAAQGPGAGATLPQPPAAAGQPVESFENSDLGGEFEGEGEGDLQPKPPGSICPVCSSEDLDIIKGEGQCNNCGSEFKYKISIDVTKWADMLGEGEEEIIEEELPGLEGEGFEIPETPETPAAAASTKNGKVVKEAIKKSAFASMTRITPEALNKIKESKIELGSVSPLTGSTNTLKVAGNQHLCLDTGVLYNIDYKVSIKDPKKVYAQWAWTPEDANPECPECEKTRQQFVGALKDNDIEEKDFDAMSLKAKGETILKLKKAGALKTIKTASGEEKIIDMIKQASVSLGGDKFPMASCVEKLARRYGEEAVALSGPCEGKALADCVCNSLKKASVYSNGLAIKVADIWSAKEASTECLEDYVRMGMDLKQASSICGAMKNKYASFDDKFAQELEEFVGEEVMEEEVPGIEEDPFEEGEEFETEDEVTNAIVELTRALGKEEEVDAKLDETLGEDPMTEEHHEEGPVGEDIAEEVVEEVPMGGAPEEEAVVEEEMVPMEAPTEEAPMEEAPVVDEGQDKTMYMEEGEAPEVDVEVEIEGEDNGVKEVLEEVKDKINEIEEKLEGGVSEEVGNEEEMNENPGVMNPEEVDEEVEKEGEPSEGEGESEMEYSDTEYNEKSASIMRKGYIGRTGEMSHLDFGKLANILNKQAGDVKVKPAQDAVPFSYSDKGKIGDEDSFSADDPDAPSKGDSAKMGDEHPPTSNKADVPASDARMVGEKQEPELKPELDDTATGGDKGQGSSKAASTTERTNDLADRILEAQTKIKRKFDQDDEDIKPYSGDSFIGDEKSSIGDVPAAKPAAEQKVPRKDDFIGNEKESIGEKPSEKMMPDIPTKDDRINGEKDNEKIAPEKDDEATGNIKNAESETRRKEATRIAGRMLQDGKISVEKLASKIVELERYETEQLQDFEKNIFATEKGLDKPSDGIEQTPVISQEKSEMRKIASSQDNSFNELKNALQGMFALDRKNKAAQEDNDIQLRKEFGKI